MELQNPDGTHIISKKEKEVREEQDKLAYEIKRNYFFVGRLLDKFVKLTEQLRK